MEAGVRWNRNGATDQCNRNGSLYLRKMVENSPIPAEFRLFIQLRFESRRVEFSVPTVD